ncbi:hypothetical protein GUITHDRAFT_105743 [Guillardia theta CCMP2712]|uniref:PWWP domain-containing protein n=1 Tax=Guillardia theta (strain CCMP2712) TaxID=905079 RepID=L1JJ96_GUITC|nr:hypothetical protein GUITHDRAFT_105743 [Guillardia theta CCMP2712]EKX48598.1 hypothetical protein GUITHDRAFT_105743 [Guillardia theta CCMP2712]|eukprot:XP_005835578.1 hypothetical protein GUITHDRAFT_105743 [Guillardia theta CCMP2712]
MEQARERTEDPNPLYQTLRTRGKWCVCAFLELSQLKQGQGFAVEVEFDGEWWDANIKAREGDSIGGARLRRPPPLEVVWARVKDSAAWPGILIQGSLKNPYSKKASEAMEAPAKLIHTVSRDRLSAFTSASIPKRIRQLAEAIEYAKAAMATGTIPEAMRMAKESTSMSKGGKRRAPSLDTPLRVPPKKNPLHSKERKRAAMRKLGLLPPEVPRAA